MFKKLLSQFILALMVMLSIVACQSTSNNVDNTANNLNNCQIITHDSGETQVCSPIEKIAVLGVYNLAQLLSVDTQPYSLGYLLSLQEGEYITQLDRVYFPSLGEWGIFNSAIASENIFNQLEEYLLNNQ